MRKPQPADRRHAQPEPTESGIYLYWLPLGAGGSFVKFNGRVFEFFQARAGHRPVLNLYHSALVVIVPEGRYVIEDGWPIPDADGAARGVAVEGPVFARFFGRSRLLRYEVRRWLDGVIADRDAAVDSPRRVDCDPDQPRRILDLVGTVPPLTWGRDERSTGDMWNSNSVVSYLLARCGIPAGQIDPPANGRAPGWWAGLTVASRCHPETSGSTAGLAIDRR